MRTISLLLAFIFCNATFSQSVIVNSKSHGSLEFVQSDYGLAKVAGRQVDELKNSPTGDHGWLKEFEIIDKTDSIKILPKANFGLVYIVKSQVTEDIEVEIEWIYPEKITNNEGKKFKSIKYPTKRPTNTPSASSYSLDEPYEMVKGEWKMNLYIEGKRVCSKSFYLY